MRLTTRQILILFSTILMVLANVLFPQLSDIVLSYNPDDYGKYYESFSKISPKEYTFLIIWAFIFTGMLCFAVYQALPAQRNISILDQLLWPTIWVNLSNGIVLYADYGYNLVIILVLLIALGTAFTRIQQSELNSKGFNLFVKLPFSLFFAWISIALIVTISQILVYWNWDAFQIAEEIWAALLIGAATLIGGFIYQKFKSLTYVLVVIWAFIGVYFGPGSSSLVLSVSIFMGILALVGLVLLNRFRTTTA